MDLRHPSHTARRRKAAAVIGLVPFPTSQEGEAVLTDDGTVVHRFSEGKFFTQVIRELTLQPGRSETIRLDDNLSDVEPGTYDVALRPAVQSSVGALTERVEVIPGS